jgi:hypothetical protein
MSDEKPEWEPLPDRRPSLPRVLHVLLAVVAAVEMAPVVSALLTQGCS